MRATHFLTQPIPPFLSHSLSSLSSLYPILSCQSTENHITALIYFHKECFLCLGEVRSERAGRAGAWRVRVRARRAEGGRGAAGGCSWVIPEGNERIERGDV